MRLVRTKLFHFGWLPVLGFAGLMLLLIFFLLLGSSFLLQPGIAVAPPTSRFTLAPQNKLQVLSITGGGAPAIYFREQRTTLDQLGPLLDAAHREGRALVIKADKFTPYETVVAVANTALEHGITSVALATTPPK